MKNLFLLIVTLAFGSFVFGQTYIYTDDFEAYTAGTQLTVQNSTDWTTWSGTPGSTEDPLVSIAQAYGGLNSVNILSGNDLVKPMPNYTSGKYKMSFWMYIPAGFDGYFNTLQEFTPTPTWGMQVYFPSGLNGYIDGNGAAAATFTYSNDTWMYNEVFVDLGLDTAEYYLDGAFIHGWKWSEGAFGGNALNQLGANNFFGYDQETTCNYYFDDYEFLELDPPTNLNYTISNYYDVNLTWTAPPMEALTGYNVYRDGTQINTSLVTVTSYDDLGLAIGTYDYYVTAVYDEGESGPSNIVTVGISGPCAAPSDLYTDNITSNSAKAHWTVVGTPDTLFIEWGLTGFTPEVDPIGRDTITSPVGPGSYYDIMGLSGGTTYDWYVQSHCSDGSVSNWAGPAIFNTPLPYITIPFTEDFEPAEFDIFDNAPGNDVDWVLIDTLQVSPTHSAFNVYGNSNVNVLRLLGKFDLTAKTFAEFSFWHIAKTEGYWDHCFIEISTDGGLTYTAIPETYYSGAGDYSNGYFDEDSYTEWGTSSAEIPDNTWWKQETFNLTAYNTFSDVTLRFRLTSDGSIQRAGWLIDDITVEEMALGTLEGTVTALSLPATFIENATVSIPSLNMSTTTNPSGFYTMDIPAGTYDDVTCEEQYYAAQTATGVVITALNTTVQDFVLPYKFGPSGLSGQGWDASIDLWWKPPFDPSVTSWLSYNDGSFENAISSTSGGAGLGQMFTPPIYPCTIEQVRFFTDSYQLYSQPEDVYILAGDMSTVLGGPYTVNGVADDWITIDITDITINSGDFMIATYNQLAGGPFVGMDNSQYLANLYFGSHTGGFTELGVWGYYYVGSHEAYCSFGTKENGITQVLTATQNIKEINEGEKEEFYSEIAVQNSLKNNEFNQIKEPGGSLIMKSGATYTKGLLGYNIYRGPDPANYALLDYTTDTFYVDNPVSNNQDYYYYVSAVFDEGESVSSNERRLLPMAAQSVVYSNNFDATNGDFFGRDDWEWGAPSVVGPPAAYSPPNVWATVLDGDYSADSYSWLYQTFDLSAKGDYTAKFAKWFDIEYGYDVVWFAVDHDNDGSFNILETYTGLEDYWEMGYVKIPDMYTSAYTRIAIILNADDIVHYPGFYLDDFSMDFYVDPAMTVDPASFEATLVADGTASSHLFIGNTGGFPLNYTADVVYPAPPVGTTLESENFDAGIPGDWTIVDGGASTDTWYGATDYNGNTLDGTPFAFVDSDDAGSVAMDEELISPVFDATGYADVLLEFDQYFNSYSGSDIGDVDVWDGSAWQNVYTTSSDIGSWTNPDHQAIFITAYANAAMQVRFHYYNANYDWYWAVDNMLVQGYLTPVPPTGWLTLDGAQSKSGSVNVGAEDDDILVVFDATGISAGDYDADIEIDSNDPLSEITTIPVILHVVATGYDVTGTLTYANSYSTPLDFAEIGCKNGVIDYGTVVTGLAGEYTFSSIPDGTYDAYMPDGIKPTGGVDVIDLNLLISHILGTPLVGLSFLAGDVTWDGTVDVNDLNGIINFILGNPGWNAPDYVFENPAFVVSGANLTNVDLLSLCSGDPDGSFVPPTYCAPPTDLTATNILPNSADLSWTSPAGLSNLEWGATGFVQGTGTMVSGIAGGVYPLGGLTQLTTYDYYVQDDCGGPSQSDWVGAYTFSTTGPGSVCATAIPIPGVPFVVTGLTTCGYGDDYDYSMPGGCYYYINGDDYVFEYTPAADITIDIVLTNTDSWTGINVSQGCPDVGTCVGYAGASGGNPTYSGLSLTGGVTYYIIVSTWPTPQCTPFDISITETAGYCNASTTTYDEYISNVLCGTINNSSSWQGGVADYTAISTSIAAGGSQAITVTIGPPSYVDDEVHVWVDWNDDYIFGIGGDEEFPLTVAVNLATGTITVPVGTSSGTYRMRVRCMYDTTPVPCGSTDYGEVEDYSIVVP